MVQQDVEEVNMKDRHPHSRWLGAREIIKRYQHDPRFGPIGEASSFIKFVTMCVIPVLFGPSYVRSASSDMLGRHWVGLRFKATPNQDSSATEPKVCSVIYTLLLDLVQSL